YRLFCIQAEDGIRDDLVTGVQTCALPIFAVSASAGASTGFASDSKATLKDKKDGRTPGIKQGFSAKDIADLELFKGLSFNSVSRSEERRVGRECRARGVIQH